MVLAHAIIRVAAGQLSARLMNEADATRASIDACITEAAAQGAQLLVLPECAYPAYLLGSVASYRAADHMSGEAFVRWLAKRAAETRMHLVSGFVEDAGDVLHNSVVVIDSAGHELGRVHKRFLWNADRDWFQAGGQLDVIQTDLGPLGVLICAEMRVPEMLATLVARGAHCIAMPTCWINAARDPGCYRNPQVEFMVPARAREFGVPVICADKSGLEMPGVGYVGLSRIVRGDGSLAAEAPPTGEALITATLALGPPRRVVISDRWRRQLLTDAPPTRPASNGPREVTLAVVPGALVEQQCGGSTTDAVFVSLQQQGVEIVLAPVRDEQPAEQLAMFANTLDIRAVTFPTTADVRRVGSAQVGVVSGQAIRSFAAARVLALQGAEILMCLDIPDDMALLCTRAVENRVFVAGVSQRSGVIIGPDGTVLARCGPEDPTPVVARIDLAQSGDKVVAPRTDVFDQRRVALYRF